MKLVVASFGLFFGVSALAQVDYSKDRIIVSIHANIDPSTTAPTWLSKLKMLVLKGGKAYDLLREAEVVSAGHAWISVEQGGSRKTYGLFDGGPTVDVEKRYESGIYRSLEISQDQLLALNNEVRALSEYQWTGYYNCASYAADLWKAATGEVINPVPTKLYYVDSSNNRHDLKENVRLKPLPPAPLGVIQELIKLNNNSVVSNSKDAYK